MLESSITRIRLIIKEHIGEITNLIDIKLTLILNRTAD